MDQKGLIKRYHGNLKPALSDLSHDSDAFPSELDIDEAIDEWVDHLIEIDCKQRRVEDVVSHWIGLDPSEFNAWIIIPDFCRNPRDEEYDCNNEDHDGCPVVGSDDRNLWDSLCRGHR